MHVSQNHMRLVFAKLNINSHRAFVNVLSSSTSSSSSTNAVQNKRMNIYKDKGKVYQYVKRLQCGNDNNNNDANGVNINIGVNKKCHHRKSQSIEDLVKRDTYERIKYNHCKRNIKDH